MAVASGRADPIPFGREWCKKYLPHYFAGEPADFHAELFADLRNLHERRGSKTATIAPREGAKSTVKTLAYVLFCAVERLEPFTLILSDSADQAREHLKNIRDELETNPALAADYPSASGPGPVWRIDRLQLKNGCVVAALGTRKKVRGRKSRQTRPSLVVFDDCENNDTIASPGQRDKVWRWATREVIPAGSAETNFLSVGSALHREALAVRLGQLPGWKGRTFRAVHRWPERMDLWAEWERLATNLADDARGATADAFYLRHKSEMDRGAVVYWPSRWPLLALMKRRAEIGPAAFDTEYQGVPRAEGLSEFPPEWFEDRPGMPFWFDQWPRDLVFKSQSLDPSKGRASRTSDFQAHARVGLDAHGTFWVEGDLFREPPVAMVSRSLDLYAAWGPADVLVVEGNEGSGLVQPEYERQCRERNVVVPLRARFNSQRKEQRILRLGLYLGRGQMRFRRTRGTQMMVDQFRDFGAGEHDDGPDAVELAVREIEEAYSGR